MEVNEKLYQRAQEEMETKITMMSRQLEQLQRHYEIQKERVRCIHFIICENLMHIDLRSRCLRIYR